jgi:tRNA (guanine37-N1)-methyltransferase
MRIDVLTLFPKLFEEPFGYGIFKRAAENGLVRVNLVDIRDYAHDKHRTADDYPYGGGAGMVMKPEPLFEAVEAVREEVPGGRVILLTPQGRPFGQELAAELAREDHLVFICGHYEGVDERVREHLADDEISIGDYVLTGGEIPAMVVMDAVLRLIPGVLGSGASPVEESHAGGLLEYPQYTRPPDYRGWKVPEVLLSGNHAEIAAWRREQELQRTLERRPDLLAAAELGPEYKKALDRLKKAGLDNEDSKDRE